MILRAQVSFGYDTALSRDRMTITPHFSTTTNTTDADGLADDLATAFAAYSQNGPQVEVKIVDAQGSKPVYPIGQAVANAGAHPASAGPREVALCLSYFSGRNVPRRRGRLYIPMPIVGASGGVAPNASVQAKVGQVADILANLGGVDVDWCVFSRADNQAYSVTNWWVDNEWDTVRSRGLRATNRQTGAVSE